MIWYYLEENYLNTQIQLRHNTNLCPHFVEFFWKTGLLILAFKCDIYGRVFSRPWFNKLNAIYPKVESDWRAKACWAKLEELQKFILHHSEKCKQIILNVSSPFAFIATHDLSIATSFIVAALYFMVKASQLMTYQFWQCQW